MTVNAFSPANIARQKQTRRDTVAQALLTAECREQTLGATSTKTQLAELSHLCCDLHRLAQTHLKNTAQNFCDFNELVRITKALKSKGLALELAVNIQAPAAATGNSAVLSSPEYKNIRNKSIAALATIADLPTKSTLGGSMEFQRGVREGYKRAGDIAALFLEDIQMECDK